MISVLHLKLLTIVCLTGAAIERMGGQGTVVNAYVGDKKPSQDIASCFNFPADFMKAIPVSLATLTDYLIPGTLPNGELWSHIAQCQLFQNVSGSSGFFDWLEKRRVQG